MAGRRLQRDREQGMIGGVCAGLAAHLDYDVALLRLVAVLLAFACGIGVIAYLTLWVLLPEAASTTESPPAVARDNVRETAGLVTRAAHAGRRAITRDRDGGEGQEAEAASPPPEERDAELPPEPAPPDPRPPDTRPPGQ